MTFIAGSGMVGCLYDNGPEEFEEWDDAVAFALAPWDSDPDFSQDEMREMVELFRRYEGEGFTYYFRNPADVGADYVEVVPS